MSTRLPPLHSTSGYIDHRRFVELLSEQLPDAAVEIDPREAGLLHCEMGAFSRATVRALTEGDLETVRRHFAFAEMLLSKADPDVENALYVSYIETFVLGSEEEQKARTLMPSTLGAAFDDVQNSYDQLDRS